MMIWGFMFSQQYTNYSTINGLPSNHVYRITQDVNGFIWFITDKGMVKYNGTDFKKFTIRDGLPTNDIWNIVATPNGKIWYFSKSPKIGYIRKDSVYSFPSATKGEILTPLNQNIVGNDITFNNSFNYYILENNKWEPYDIFGKNSSSKEYRQHVTHKIINRIINSNNKDSLDLISNEDRLVKRIKNNEIVQYSHTRGQINDSTFIYLSSKGYFTVNLNNLSFKVSYFKDVLGFEKSKYVRMHVVNAEIQLTGEGFVGVLDKEYNLKNIRYIPKNLKSHFSFIDKEKNLWIATFRNGVYKLSNSKQRTTYSLTNEKVGTIKKIDSKIITSVLDKGFYQYEADTKQFIPSIKETEFPYGVFNIKELNTKYYITDKKITSIHNAKKTVYQFHKTNNNLNETARQLVYHNAYLYGNFTSGLNKLNPSDLSIETAYISNGIRTFISFKDELIVATSNGLKILKNDSIQALQIPKNKDNSIHNKPILSLSKLNNNTLLVGTDAYGAFITDLKTITPLRETEYLSINDSFIENNNLWLATNEGVWHYKKTPDNKCIFVATYDENDGLLLKNAKSVYATEKDLLISSNIGIVSIPRKKNNSKYLLDIYVANTNYNGNKIISNSVKYTSDNTISFSIANVDFSENTQFSYEYQLLPIQKEWISTTSKQLLFNDLSPNKYKLNIRSKGKTNTVVFKILPLWHQTWLAKIFFGLLLFSFIVGLILLIRKRELKKQAIELNAKRKLAEFELYALRSQMNPHFVFNSLNAIQYFINDNKVELSEKYLVKFSKLIRMFFDFSKHKVISLEDEICLLNGYLEIEKLRFGHEFNYNINIDKNLNKDLEIPAMLLQPVVENAVNHGLFHKHGKGLISISFTKINPTIYKVIIEDDGIGREKATELKRHSLNQHLSKSTQILKERINLLNQSKEWHITYKVTDLDKTTHEGTRVYLKFNQL